ncbi:MAG: DUF4238 domain-containing protein [Candidatus Limnocylindrales bacterium]
MNETRAPHTIPQLHLRRFGYGPKNQGIWVYDKEKELIFPGTVRSSSVRPDYYHVARASGRTEGGLEQEFFQKTETIAAPHLADLLSLQRGEQPFDPMARFHLAHYLAIQRARVPAMVERAEEAAVFHALAQNDLLLSDPDRFSARAAEVGLKPEEGKTLEDLRLEWLTLFRSGELEIRPPTGFALVHVLDLALKTQPRAFFEMAWEVREATAPPWLLLGDEPVVAVMPAGTAADEEQGFKTPGVEIVMPLSPGRLLVLRGRRTADAIAVTAPLRSADADDWVRRANVASWHSASLHVWARDKADLEAIHRLMTPEERTQVRHVEVRNLPDEWRVYLQPGMTPAPSD